MSPVLAVSIPFGVVLGLGLWSLVALVPRVGAPRLSTRIAPYLSDVSPTARELAGRRPAEPASLLSALLEPFVARLRRLLTAVLGGDEAVAARLRRAGSSLSVERFRSRQLLWAAGGAVLGVLLAAVLARVSVAGAPVLIATALVAAALGLLAPEQLLARAARSRLRRLAAELPTVLEFMTLALSAGEGILDALKRVARTGNGELAREFGRVVAEVNSGLSLAEALQRCASTIGLPALSRTIDQLLGALERGTPLVGVLRAQAQDSRDESKRQLLEAAGRKEVAMLFPLVFLILPVTIVFAIFPGILVLQLGF
ncbi:type II secretion system F family protein [Lysinimonas soli]|uniref:Type II secretion system F family protein n=1 Tax=Lysinimonas soli TaxID=1074233 RepID=A0ABW0NL08_9MICO